MKFIKNVSINSQDSPIVFDSAKNLLDHALKFGITSQLLKSIAQSDMKILFRLVLAMMMMMMI